MQKEVRSASVDVFIEEHSPNKGFSPRADLHSKYAKTQESLVSQVEESARTIEQLHVLLEALTPMPGFDAEKYRRIIFAKHSKATDVEVEDIDHRDSKIVSLAKKARNLTVLLNKEKAENDKFREEIASLHSVNDKLTMELEVSRINRGGSSSGSRDIKNDDSENDVTTLKKELSSANKALEEMRRKLVQAKDETKTLKATLSKELGDGVTLEEAVDGSWRGRAQQIVMLKSKVSLQSLKRFIHVSHR